MIKNSIVLKLWLTIVGMVVVVLVLLSVLLQQFFATYVEDNQSSSLIHWTLSISDELQKNDNLEHLLLSKNLLKKVQNAEMSYTPSLKENNALDKQFRSLSTSERYQLQSGKPIIIRQIGNGSPQITIYDLVKRPGQNPGLLAVSQQMSVLDAPLDHMRNLILFDVLLGVFLATGLAFVVSKNLSKPLVEMNHAAELMQSGDFKHRVNVVTSDEVGRLGSTFNAMAAQLDHTIHALSMERDQLSTILQSLQDGVMATNTLGQITLANLPALRILRQMSLSERGIVDVSQLPDAMQSLLQAVQNHGESMSREWLWQDRNILLHVIPLREPDSQLVRGTLTVLRDITEERQMDSLRKDFLANVSHELRTPLSMLQGYSEALLDELDNDPEMRRELVQIIHEEAMRMKRLVNDLLDLASLESGQFQMKYAPVEINSLIKKVSRKFFTLSSEKGVSLQVHLFDRPILLEADKDRLEQVFTNLLDNAFRHTEKGKIEISIETETHYVYIQVKDTGSGIPPEDVPYVFERFYKADKARTRSAGGTGLGLAIARYIIVKHGGEIIVKSALHVGTTFTVVLPLKRQVTENRI
ncbi:HAMP domain-containing sensor histidine kinase [Alicyclobacillus tolerans]|uniref:histidine kinase n=2 Tax=Alicyclobacillus tolerans TaxID=90970 RepID=A0ABT9LWM3_9BACL|nr:MULTISPECIES: ATP-binding protein [Alicyclobacillus]MDP9728666.1 two-component system sensor histidine kinase ResE [Alicyclobacillus tengchongensis]QRF23308.1 cell wall metabolism sensor histidine kinase WalK [Alicyclobacillus sp. TC]SHK42462.1 PAS/PAC sensor signal transduction histidine kinase [Alicyclobacillus montanus]